MLCVKCKKEIPKTTNSKKYCSTKCSKLYLKSEYKKKYREKINAYNREYRKRGMRISGKTYEQKIKPKHLKIQPICQRCSSSDNLNICHIKPRWAGGKHNNNLITLCRKCHYEFDKLLRDFWKKDNKKY